MASGGGKPPQAPDPSQIISLQNQYNRNNTVGPYGSSTWSPGGPGGHETQTIKPSDQMQGAMDRAFQMSAQPFQRQYAPQGVDQLSSALLKQVGSHYGLQGGALNTNLQQQKPQSQSPMSPGGGQGMPNMQFNAPGGMGPAQGMPGMSNSGGNQLGGQLGAMGGMGLQNGMGGSAMGALQAMQGNSGGGNQTGGGMPPINYNGAPPGYPTSYSMMGGGNTLPPPRSTS